MSSVASNSLAGDASRRQDAHAAMQPPCAVMGVSVVVPLFNERECAERLVESLVALQQALVDRYDFEFLLVDDGSSDETAALLARAVADRPQFRVLKHGVNRGIAAAIQTGLRSSRNEIVVSMDCDGSYDPMLLAEMIPRLGPGVDLVTASPYHAAGQVENVPLWRLRLSRLASHLYGAACRHKLSCYTSCFRVYRRSAAAPIDLKNEGFVGVAELLWKILDRGGQVTEQPAMLRARIAGASKMRVVRAGIGHLRLMCQIVWLRAARRAAAPSVRSSEASAVDALGDVLSALEPKADKSTSI